MQPLWDYTERAGRYLCPGHFPFYLFVCLSACLFLGGDISLFIPLAYCCINNCLKFYDIAQIFNAKPRCCKLGTWTGLSWVILLFCEVLTEVSQVQLVWS